MTRSFSAWSHVVSMLFAQLTHAIGLNDVCDALRLHSGPLSALRGATAPSRNNLSHANKRRDAALAEGLFWAVLEHLQKISPGFAAGGRGKGLAPRFRRVIHVVDSRANYPQPMRRVRALVEVDGKEREMEFLTNNLQWSARSVADLYRCRWQIEVFFKQIKQSLQLCDFLGNSANAVRWQVWTALLLYVLMRFLCVISRWNHSFTRLFTLLRAALWRKIDLWDLLRFCGTAGGHFRYLGTPQNAYLPGFAQ